MASYIAMRPLRCTARLLVRRGPGAPHIATGFMGSGFASDTSQPGGHFDPTPENTAIAPRDDPDSDPTTLQTPIPIPLDMDLNVDAAAVENATAEDPSRAVDYQFAPPDFQSRFEKPWPSAPHNVSAALHPAPTYKNRVRTNAYRRVKYRQRRFEETQLSDKFGNHLFNQWEMWESFLYAHHTRALSHSEYLQTLSAFLHFIDGDDAASQAWVVRQHVILNAILERGWRWGPWEYTLVIQSHARALDYLKCEEWFRRMLDDKVDPIQMTFGAMLRAYAALPQRIMPLHEAQQRGQAWFARMVEGGYCGSHVEFIKVWGGMQQMSYHKDHDLPPRHAGTVLANDKKALNGGPKEWWPRRHELCALCGDSSHRAANCPGPVGTHFGTEGTPAERPAQVGWWSESFRQPLGVAGPMGGEGQPNPAR
eukprot:TRINITY_DN9942_c0_g1_i1.p1 TRINITY_DN9942_c0_g1~~TRINITY_DN9942_c0_g1_i1.p1  ORF type:complete len:423 (-),score=72.83 TRINITY_DN9942_c0_g1_i1:192-1460(-)